MATLESLLPFLCQGYTLQSVRGEVIRPLSGSNVEWLKAKGYRFEPEKYTLAQMASMHDMWDWSVLFVDPGGKPYGLTTVGEIEQAIQNGIPGTSYAAPAE